MEARDQITEQFREAVRKSEAEAFPAMEQVWERVTARLDEDEKRPRKVIPFRTIGIAAAVLVLLGLGIFILSQNKEQAIPGTMVQQKVTPIPGRPVPAMQKPGTTHSDRQVVVKNNSPVINHKPKQRPAPRVMKGSGDPIGITPYEPALTPTTGEEPATWAFKGKVVDEHGEGLPGASVKIMGAASGTVTDADGNYELQLNRKAILAVNAMGYGEQLIHADARKPGMVTTTMSYGNNALTEVTVIQPYGPNVTTERYTGAADVLPSKLISNMPVSDFTRALQGAAPGIQVTNGNSRKAKLRLRRITGTSQELTAKRKQERSKEVRIENSGPPLYVVDRKIFNGDLSDIDVNDVKEIKVIKGAEAATLYGKKGINGVLQVTTKSGKGYKAGRAGFFKKIKNLFHKKQPATSFIMPQQQADAAANTEEYDPYIENPFESPVANPLSTFSIDVDNAAYTNIRRMINNGQQVPKSAVRIEEMINYFDYHYPQPQDQHPFAIHTDYSETPWNSGHKLLRIGLQGKLIPNDKLPPSNLVFLVDVSGSMSDDNKLPLLKSSMKLLVAQLRKEDNVAIVVYAGAAGLVLPSTPGDRKKEIIDALDRLEAGGGTAGGQGIALAYDIALQHFKKEGNNRVILATDGDFNIGASSDADMQTLIEQKRKSGVFLTCLGYGMGNYKDAKMELLADKGNGNYAYIDNLKEANRFLVKEFSGTMYSIAKDVKIQVEFNPAYVQSYRLIGYENRRLKAEDFTNDAIDAGELGSGHKVTALYEIIPAGVKSIYTPAKPGLKYTTVKQNAAASGNELATVKFRYKKPDGNTSTEMVHTISHNPVSLNNAGADFKLAAAVAWFGLKLRNSELVSNSSKEAIVALAKQAVGEDENGYRKEFIGLIESAQE